MRSNSHAAIVELFPENVFLEDMSIPASSLDLDYYAVQGTTFVFPHLGVINTVTDRR
jgi:hypothetical protein